MTRVIRHRCDNCQREAEPHVTDDGQPIGPAGWWSVHGPVALNDFAGEYEFTDEHHLCSADCIVEWGNRQPGRDGPWLCSPREGRQ